jgi:hypothetical protein
MRWPDRALGFALAAASLAALAWLSNAPLTVRPSADAVLRLAWSARPERVERCREQSQEELAKLPAHMRQPRICEGVTAEYQLIVRDASGIRVNRTVRGGGLRRDRRLYVFEELPLATGPSRIDVRFARADLPGSAESSGDSEPSLGPAGIPDAATAAIPAELQLAAEVTAGPREVVLVTYDPEQRALVAVRDR